MIFDSHCHAWRKWPYQEGVPDPRTRGSADALLWEMDDNGVERAAVVCARMGGEVADACANDDNNDYVAAEVRKHPDRLVMVADVDGLWTLDEHHRPGASKRLREAVERYELGAFTHYVNQENDGWLVSDEGQEFFRTAAELDLVASLAFSPAWQGDLRVLALANPTMPMIVHHQGFARLGNADFEADLAAILRNADLPNLYVKLSGFHYLALQPWDFPFCQVQDRVTQPLIEAFGTRRLVWGSDFSAARPFVTYTQSLEVVRSRIDGLTGGDLDQILGGTFEVLLRTRRPLEVSSAP
ncbi:MAG: hypothetical protein JWM85_2682 [Acidimicrobiaceae bacterium]|nr:hypothetical protein [Acidimicrobiaceae bacterium]